MILPTIIDDRQQGELERKLSALAEEWRWFVEYGKPADPKIVSRDIWESWQRSRACGVDPHGLIRPPVIDWKRQLEKSRELIEAGWPYIEMMSEIIPGSGLRFDLFDRDGFALKTLSDPDVVAQAQAIGLTIGGNYSEAVSGTCGVGMVLREDRPIQVVGAEHYNRLYHSVNCSAAPIHDGAGQIIGIVNIASCFIRQTRQTLGLATSIAETIENRLALNRTVSELMASNDTLSKIIEDFPRDMGDVDGQGRSQARMQQKCGQWEGREPVSMLKVVEDIVIETALRHGRGNLSLTARRLGIARSTLYQKIRENERIISVANSHNEENCLKIEQFPSGGRLAETGRKNSKSTDAK